MLTPEESKPTEAFVPQERASKYPPRKCANPKCGKEFIPLTKRKLYCSGSCNAIASKIREGQRFISNEPIQSVETQKPSPMQNAAQTSQSFDMSGLSGVYAIPPHATMMIEHHRAEAGRWEKKYDQEVADHRETKRKLEDLDKQLHKEENPGGLQGFAEKNPELAGKLVDFAQVMAEKFLDRGKPAGVPAIAENSAVAVEGLDESGNAMVQEFAKWLPKIHPETQKNLWEMLEKLSQLDEEQMNYIILNIRQQWA